MDMSWEALAAIGQAVGAIAVVVTVVYLARQVNENVRQLRLASVNDSWTVVSDAFAPIYNSEKTMAIWVDGLHTPAALDARDTEIFVLLATRLMSAFDNVSELHALGVVNEERFANYLAFACEFLATPGGRLWRERSGLRLSQPMLTALARRPRS